MELLLKRKYKGNNYTIGDLYINGEFFCNTIEDKDRDLDDSMSEEKIKEIKVYAKTAIPRGKYEVQLTYSPKFKTKLPLLLNVKGFSYIRIHNGTTEKDSAGCIILGNNSVKGKVLQSRITIAKLMNILNEVKEKIYITIE